MRRSRKNPVDRSGLGRVAAANARGMPPSCAVRNIRPARPPPRNAARASGLRKPCITA